jgi:uncharacterized membrane protein YheB (UPF0754 family)
LNDRTREEVKWISVFMTLPSLLLIFALAGFLALLFPLFPLGSLAQEILLHGFEGALVGGLCDWFAVVKAFESLEKKRDEIADEIANFVRSNIVGTKEHILKKVETYLDDPQVHQVVVSYLEKKFERKEQVSIFLSEVFEKHFELATVAGIANYRFGEGRDLGGKALDFFKSDPRITNYLKFCLVGGLEQIEKTRALDQLLPLLLRNESIWLRMGAKSLNVRNKVREVAQRLIASESDVHLRRVVQLITVAGVDGYKEAWNNLPQGHKEQAVSALVSATKNLLIDECAELLQRQKGKLGEIQTLNDYRPLKGLVEMAANWFSEELLDSVEKFLSHQLKAKSAHEFRLMIEERTLSTFQLIRINGTLLGFVLGCFAGVITLH